MSRRQLAILRKESADELLIDLSANGAHLEGNGLEVNVLGKVDLVGHLRLPFCLAEGSPRPVFFGGAAAYFLTSGATGSWCILPKFQSSFQIFPNHFRDILQPRTEF